MSCWTNRRIPCALAALAICLSAGTLRAAIVYEQLPDGASGTQVGYFADGNQGVNFYDNRVADNFTLSSSTSIIQVQWWGSSENFLTNDILTNTTDFVISFFNTAVPAGSPVYTETIPLGSITATPTGNLSIAGSIEYLFSANLTTPVAIPAGVPYSIHIGALLISPGDDAFAWDTANADNVASGDGLGANANDGIWETVIADDLAFRLLNGASGGRCCLPAGDCDILSSTACASAGGTYGGDNTTCGNGSICRGRCCDPFGSCEVTGPIDCVAPAIFGGLGTNCNGDPCVGRCCQPNGTCTLTGPAGCTAPNRFGGLGSTCSDVREYGNPTPATTEILDFGASLPSIINVPDSFTVQDVAVKIKIQHTFRNDIVICLTGPGGSPTVGLTAVASCTTGGVCGGEDNFNAIFDDEGAAIVCASVNLSNLANPPDSVIPSESLSAFDGLPAAGDWTLAIFDDAGGDSGTLLEWSLLLDNGQACVGACCTGQSCSRLSSAACATAGGVYQGDATSCSPSPCAPNGACCVAAGCSSQAQADCASAGGVYSGDGTTCASPAPCQASCCKGDGTCDLRTIASCNAISGAVAGTLGSSCPAVPCAPLGACCAETGICTSNVTQVACTVSGGIRWTGGASCTPNLCTGRCCAIDGSCTITVFNGCPAPSVYGGDGSSCTGNPCMGRCCQANGSCAVSPVITCTGTSSPGVQNCDAVQVIQFDNVNMIMADVPDGVLSQNFQTVEGPAPLIITDLDVDLSAVHTWPGDVQITIEHLGTSVIVYDRPGNPISTFGCATPNFDIILDDEGAGGPIEGICNAAPPSALSPPNYVPNNPLAAFDGLDALGEWTLTSRDFFSGGDTGTLLSWSLHVGFAGQACPVAACTCRGDVTGDSVVNGKDVKAFAQCVASGGTTCPCADMNHSGTATSADIPAFITAVLTSTCGP